ncbi:glutaredoxin [Galendromus occidentalis]|uniref:Glutaredoxin n=1 Tax=Galendromus occidentalis TaxID=34638 RepID=A0AAJ6QN57_9ACAR|nr:glutaredoxin [Galendromus occidentalis]
MGAAFGSRTSGIMAEAAAAFVNQKITASPLVVFSKTTCPYCDKAKRILEKYKAQYDLIELNQREDGQAIQDVLKGITGARSVPRVFIGGKCIGGGDDTARLDSEGKLESLLKEAGVKMVSML